MQDRLAQEEQFEQITDINKQMKASEWVKFVMSKSLPNLQLRTGSLLAIF